MSGIRIDFSAERCEWEIPIGDVPCPKRGAGLVAGEWLGVYCSEHLAIWRAELERRAERDRPKLPGLQDWYRRMANREPMNGKHLVRRGDVERLREQS